MSEQEDAKKETEKEQQTEKPAAKRLIRRPGQRFQKPGIEKRG